MTAKAAPSPRQAYEAAQDKWLAPQAVREAASGGRKFPEPDHPYRTCFQRDRDRIVHSSAFRRLDYKTQVFVPHEQDHFRTRLTHTLEVAQIGRDLARALRFNEDLVEAVALAHDLGHPPFGHVGEGVLNELAAACGGFEHNRQGLRVVDYLEHPYPGFRGLNLTQVVRECQARHETRYDAPACAGFDGALAGPLEGQLVGLADEIAYTSADVEDALAAGWISAGQLAELRLWGRAWRAAEADAPDARAIHKRIRAGKGLLAEMANDAIATTTHNIAEWNVRSADDARRAAERCVAFSPEMRADVDAVGDFLLEHVYRHPDNAGRNARARGVLADLFGAYVAEPDKLPERYRRRIGDDGLERVVCDYIAGMTDRYCRQQHARICG